MKLRKPKYYDEFKCIGSDCQDTCCAGWEIEIDEETAQRYQDVTGELGERLRENITETKEEIYFNLQDGKRCPFLNKKNLCDLILGLGEDSLCDICREHPRHYQWFGEYTEVGLGLCCEEAGRLLFRSEAPLDFLLCEKEDESEESGQEDGEEAAYIELLLSARETAFAIVQNRNLRMEDRLILLLQYGEELQNALDADAFEELEQAAAIYRNQAAATSAWQQMLRICRQQTEEDSSQKRMNEIMRQLSELLEIYENLEALDDTWPRQIKGLQEQLPDLITQWAAFSNGYPRQVYEYEHFSVYLLYRYFMEALFDGDVLGKIKFLVMSVLIVRLMDIDCYQKGMAFSQWNRIQITKQYSKEIEYCTENMEALGELCWQKACMSTESLIEMLKIFDTD